MAKAARPKKRLNSVDLERTDNIEGTKKKQWVVKAQELLLEGYSVSYIRDLVKREKEGSKSKTAIDTILSEANTAIKLRQFSKQEEIIPIHIDRYNKRAQQLLKVQDIDEKDVDGDRVTWEDFYRARRKKIEAYNQVINTLVQKEDLLQMHNKNLVVDLNTETTVEVREKKPKLHFGKLSFEEQVELYRLVKKARKDDDLLGVIQRNDEDQVTVDVEHEEVKEEVNITKIKIEEGKKDPVKIPITASDPTVRLRESLVKLAAKRFKEAGGTLTEDEEKLINE